MQFGYCVVNVARPAGFFVETRINSDLADNFACGYRRHKTVP